MRNHYRRGVIAIGPVPPPFDGQSMAFQMLVRELERRGTAHTVVDISARSLRQDAPRIQRAFDHLRRIPIFVYALLRNRRSTIYLTIAQSRFGFLRDLVFVSGAWFARKRIVCHLHGGNYGAFYRSQPSWLKLAIRWMLQRVDRIVVLGEPLRPMFDFAPPLEERLEVVPNGLPIPLPSWIEKDSPEAGRPVRLLYLSNLIESKGYLDLLEAVRLLRDEFRLRVEATFCGQFLANPSDDKIVRSADHARSLFDDMVERNQLSEVVAYSGVVTGDDKRGLLRKADFFVLPTSYDNEGQPLSILEAMSFGCNVVTTKYRAIPEMIQDGLNGWFIPAHDPRAIAATIQAVWARPDVFARVSREAYETVVERFSAEAHLRRLLEVLLPAEIDHPPDRDRPR